MSPLLRALALLSIVVALGGCVTPIQQRENQLSAAGFRTKPAVTVEQISMLSKLPTDRISPITHHGHVLFVYPDPAHKLLYVGSPTEYAAYKKVRVEQKVDAKEQEQANFQQQSQWADMDGWKGLSDGFYNF